MGELMANPRLSDVHPTRCEFQPGDRCIVRVSCKLDKIQTKQLIRSVQGYTGEHVRVLIADCLSVRVVQQHTTGDTESLVGPEHTRLTLHPNQVNMSCSKVDLIEGDQIDVFLLKPVTDQQYKAIFHHFKEWVGDFELRVIRTA